MNRQSQLLFEAPFTSEATLYTNPFSNPEGETEWELPEINPYILGEEEWEQESGYPSHRQTIRETVSGFSRYSNAVPPKERVKIARIAQMIIKSHRSGQPIRTIRLVGHADRDVQRGASFERKISGDRAQKVRTALIEAIERLSKPLGALPPISSRINWPGVAAGATQLVVQNPATESERSRNRRVDIYLSTAHNVDSRRRYRSPVSFEVSALSTLSPKLERLIGEFCSRIGDKIIDRSNCFKAVAEAARRLSEKAPKEIACQLSYVGSQLVRSKQNDSPLSRSVVCCPFGSNYFNCANKNCGHCSGVNGRYLILKYQPLTQVIRDLKCALDRGCIVKTGVLSGLCDDKPDLGCAKQLADKGQVWRDCPEHWLLIIGYDNNTFIFWDSARMSSISRCGHEFGLLHYDPLENRLTTAPVDPTQDTMTVIPLRGGDVGGWHVFDNRQKRYQVLALQIAGRFQGSNGNC
jgi:outer membrane protein OmpA-like peptidoglycan-associated protein